MEPANAFLETIVTDRAKSTVVKLDRHIPTDFEWEEPKEFEVPSYNAPVSADVMSRALENNRRIAIRPSRLKELQELEASMPVLIEKAMTEMNQQKLAALREKDKENPDAVKARVKKYTERHREEINARRREQWAAKKGTKATTPSLSESSSPAPSYISPGSKSVASSASYRSRATSSSSSASSSTPINIICEGNVIDFR